MIANFNQFDGETISFSNLNKQITKLQILFPVIIINFQSLEALKKKNVILRRKQKRINFQMIVNRSLDLVIQ